jgi:hypothetical protein
MHKILQKLLFIEKFEIKTKISKERAKTILKMEAAKTGDYRTYFSENVFCVAEKTRKSLVFGSIHNSFAPVAVGKLSEQDGMTVISGLIRMRLLVCLPWYLVCLFSVLAVIAAVVGLAVGEVKLLIGIPCFLFCYGLPFFAFGRPAKRLKTFLERVLVYE